MGETYFIKKKKESNYTQIANTCVKDERLSWKEKGLHTYLMTLPSDWKIYMTEIVNHSRDGKAALYSAVQGLEKFGYLKRIRKRDENGRFENLVYMVYEDPSLAETEEPLSENREMEKPNTEECNSDNQPVPITNTLPNTNNIQKTEPTNSSSVKDDSEADNTQTVSESVFINIIKGLFDDEYPFDKNFEADVYKRLSNSNIEESHIKDYMQYVFERTKSSNIQKNFDGYFRKLALASSITRDFRNSTYMKKPEVTKKTERKIKYIDCPICSTRFDELENYCPNCSVSVQEINNPTQPSFIVKKKYFKMTDAEKQKYDRAYSDFEEKIKVQYDRPFLIESEKLQFWTEYGLL